MRLTYSLIFGALAALLVACGGSPSIESRDVKVDSQYSGGAVSNTLVLALVEDKLHDVRVRLERSLANEMKAAGIAATASYTRFDSIDALTQNPSSFEPQLKTMGFDSVLFIDLLRADLDYDSGEYSARRSAYRALGYNDAAAINFLAHAAAESKAAKATLGFALWKPGSGKDLWNSTYDINAPGNQDPETATEYAVGIAQYVIRDLKALGLVK